MIEQTDKLYNNQAEVDQEMVAILKESKSIAGLVYSLIINKIYYLFLRDLRGDDIGADELVELGEDFPFNDDMLINIELTKTSGQNGLGFVSRLERTVHYEWMFLGKEQFRLALTFAGLHIIHTAEDNNVLSYYIENNGQHLVLELNKTGFTNDFSFDYLNVRPLFGVTADEIRADNSNLKRFNRKSSAISPKLILDEINDVSNSGFGFYQQRITEAISLTSYLATVSKLVYELRLKGKIYSEE